MTFIKTKTFILVFLFFLCSLLSAAPALSSQAIDVSSINTHLSIGSLCYTLEDPAGKISIDDIASGKYDSDFTLSPGNIPNFGFTKSVYWVRFKLENSSYRIMERLIEIGFPLLDNVEIYIFTADGDAEPLMAKKEITGREIPFKERLFSHRNFVFPTSLFPYDSQNVYLRIKTDDGMIFPVSIWERSSFYKKTQKELFSFGVYYGIIIIMILYNLFIFTSTKDNNYLYYILYIAAFGMFQLSMNGLAYQFLWSASPWWGIHANPFFIGWSALLGAGFSVKFLETPVYAPVMDKLLKGLMVLSGILIIASLTVDYSITILAGQILPLSMILIAIPAAILCLKRGNRSARFYLIAWSAFFIGVILSTLRIMGLIQHNILTEHGLQIGSAFEMVLLALALADRINIMKMEKDEAQLQVIQKQQQIVENLNKSNAEIESAHKLLGVSEEKYRRLVEGTQDIIFSLDQDWNFISANKAITAELKIDTDTIAGKSFLDILYSDQKEQYVTKRLMIEKLEDFKRTKKPVQFRTQFKSPISTEPKELLLSLEYINIEGKDEILGKASHIIEDSLMKYFLEENQKYAIGNYLITAEEITHRITRNLKKYMDSSTLKLLRISLREIIINAIEHGNLEISFEEKSNAMMEDNYFETVRSRQMKPDLGKRKVLIDYSLNSDRVCYTVTDEGPGFDHREFLEKNSDFMNALLLSHGRGISMTVNTFDEVVFNEKGNSVNLIKYFNNRDES